MVRSIAHAYRAVLHICGLCAGIAIAVLALLITLDVVLRNLGITNFPWLLEVSEYVLYASTFLAAPWVLHLGSHVRVDVLVSMLHPKLARIVGFTAELMGFAASAVLGWYGLRVTLDTFSRGDILYKELVIPEWPLLAVVPVTGLLLTVEFARRAWTLLRDHKATGGASPVPDGL